jgi:hypothetical protein
MLKLESELRRAVAFRQWESRLQQADSVFARLVFLSTLRDASGRYVDPFLLRFCSARVCHETIMGAHRQTFRTWLRLSARAKSRDLKKYSDTIVSDIAAESAWLNLCRDVIPAALSIDELNLFCETAKQLAPVWTNELTYRSPARISVKAFSPAR